MIARRSNRSKVDSLQLAALLFAFSCGSSIVFIPNPLSAAAGNDAWLSLLLAFGFGTLVLSCALYLYRVHRASLIGCSVRLLGRWPTAVIAMLVILMAFFAVAAINASIGDFFTSVMMDRTPPYIFLTTSLIVSALTARAGVQIAGRMFILLSCVMIAFSVTVVLFAAGIYDPGRLLPLFDEGVLPMLHGFAVTAGFPFGEVFLVTMLLPHYAGKSDRQMRKWLYGAFALCALLLVISTVCTRMAFGAAAGYYNYSLYRLASEIHIIDFLERMEAIIGIALILGSYMKMTVLLIMLNNIVVQLCGVKDDRVLIFPITLVSMMLSLTMFKSPADFNYQVYVIWPFSVLAVGCMYVFLLTAITWIAQRIRRRE